MATLSKRFDAGLRTFFWVLIAFSASFLQVYYDYGRSAFYQEDFSWTTVMNSGAYLFFAMGMVVGVTLDYWLDKDKSQNSTGVKTLAFVLVPIVVMGFVCFAYVISRGQLNTHQQNMVTQANITILTVTAIYVGGAKFFLFLKP